MKWRWWSKRSWARGLSLKPPLSAAGRPQVVCSSCLQRLPPCTQIRRCETGWLLSRSTLVRGGGARDLPRGLLGVLGPGGVPGFQDTERSLLACVSFPAHTPGWLGPVREHASPDPATLQIHSPSLLPRRARQLFFCLLRNSREADTRSGRAAQHPQPPLPRAMPPWLSRPCFRVCLGLTPGRAVPAPAPGPALGCQSLPSAHRGLSSPLCLLILIGTLASPAALGGLGPALQGSFAL